MSLITTTKMPKLLKFDQSSEEEEEDEEKIAIKFEDTSKATIISSKLPFGKMTLSTSTATSSINCPNLDEEEKKVMEQNGWFPIWVLKILND